MQAKDDWMGEDGGRSMNGLNAWNFFMRMEWVSGGEECVRRKSKIGDRDEVMKGGDGRGPMGTCGWY